jgi:hypothetical protein
LFFFSSAKKKKEKKRRRRRIHSFETLMILPKVLIHLQRLKIYRIVLRQGKKEEGRALVGHRKSKVRTLGRRRKLDNNRTIKTSVFKTLSTTQINYTIIVSFLSAFLLALIPLDRSLQ